MKKIFMVIVAVLLLIVILAPSSVIGGCVNCSNDANDGWCVPDVNGNYNCQCEYPLEGDPTACLFGAKTTSECEGMGF